MEYILVIPDEVEIPQGFPHQYHKIKHLHDISIVKGPGQMDMQTVGQHLTNIRNILNVKNSKEDLLFEPGDDIFFRHVRVMNQRTGEYYHNRGATILVDLRAEEGRFFFSYSICNHRDNFNKQVAHKICEERMLLGDVFEVINYDPDISIVQNIYLAVGVQNDDYSVGDFDWAYVLPELYGSFTEEQKKNLLKLRKLIQNKGN